MFASLCICATLTVSQRARVLLLASADKCAARQTETAMSGMSWLHSADGEMMAAVAVAAAADDKEETGAAAGKSELVVAVAVADAAAPALEATGVQNGASAEKNASAAGGGEGAAHGEMGLGVKGAKETAAVVEVFKGVKGGGAVGDGAKKAAFVVPLQYNLAKAGTLFHQQVLLSSRMTRKKFSSVLMCRSVLGPAPCL